MNILVCVKQVPRDEDLRLDPITKTLIRSNGPGRISENDKYALETALRIREELGGKISAITMGPPDSAGALRHSLAMGVDDAFLLSDRAMGGADAYATATTLAAAIRFLEKEEPFDLILCGSQASDSDTALVMPQLAEALGYPQVSFVCDYRLEDGKLQVTRESDMGTELMAVPIPAVMSVGKTVYPARYPNIRLKLAANRRTIPSYNAEALGLSSDEVGTRGSRTGVGSSYFPVHNKNSLVVEGETAAEKAEGLLSLLRGEKLI